MYIKKEIHSGSVLEIEKLQNLKFHFKNTKRGPKISPTPNYMAKANERRAKKELARLINNNFLSGDMLITLTYAKDNRPKTPQETKNDIQNFLRNLKAAAKRKGKDLLYVGVSNFDYCGVPHHHLLLNHIFTDAELQNIWFHGTINIKKLDNSGDYTKLAEYLLKHTNGIFQDHNRRVHAKRFLRSRNLKKPEVTITIIKSDSWRETPTAPKCYFLISNSIVTIFNEVTGYPYQYYKCIRLTPLQNLRAT